MGFFVVFVVVRKNKVKKLGVDNKKHANLCRYEILNTTTSK